MRKLVKGDHVIVRRGRDKGMQGAIVEVNTKNNSAIVEGVNMYKKNRKPNPQLGIEGGIVDVTLPIPLSSLQAYDADKNVRLKVRFVKDEKGKKVRSKEAVK